MKRIVLIIALLIAIVDGSAHSTEGPIKEISRYFTYFVITPEGEYETISLWFQRQKYVGKDGKEYLQYARYFGNGDAIDSFVVLRQDGTKCFCLDTKSNMEHLMFDFGLDRGDTYFDDLNNIKYVVTDVRDTVVGDESLRLIELEGQGGKHDIWLEGVGSVYTGVMRGANASPGDVYLIRAGEYSFYPNTKEVKIADIDITTLTWEGKFETEEDREAYRAWHDAPSDLNAEFVGDTLHVWGILHASCDLLPYAISRLRDCKIAFMVCFNGEMDCYNNYEIDARIPGFEKGTYKVNLYEKNIELECAGAKVRSEAPVSFYKNQMATIILPSEPDAGKGKYYRLAGCGEGEIVFEQELQPRARVPYIIVPSEDFSIDPAELELAGLTGDTVSVDGVCFIGTYVSEVLPSLGGDGGGSFYYDIIDQTSDCSLSLSGETGMRAVVGALRAYLLVDWKTTGWNDPYTQGGTKSPWEKMPIVLRDNATSIGGCPQTVHGESSNGKCYDLQGRRTYKKPARGIYIEGGRVKAY